MDKEERDKIWQEIEKLDLDEMDEINGGVVVDHGLTKSQMDNIERNLRYYKQQGYSMEDFFTMTEDKDHPRPEQTEFIKFIWDKL